MLKTTSKTNCYRLKYSVKSVCIWSFSGPFFPAFGLNTDHKNLNMDTFHALKVATLRK